MQSFIILLEINMCQMIKEIYFPHNELSFYGCVRVYVCVEFCNEKSFLIQIPFKKFKLNLSSLEFLKKCLKFIFLRGVEEFFLE